jgi:di/tricarboxylate transporter
VLHSDYHSYAVLAIILAMVVILILDRFKTSLVFLFTAAALVLTGVVSAEDFMAGLSNSSIITIFLLVIITASINLHFNLTGLFDKAFKGVKTAPNFILRMSGLVGTLSAFMNNTPVVAVMIPYVYNWAKKHKISPSKLLMPLSFAAILGGVVTLIGTSTNLVLNGLIEQAGLEPLGFFDFTIPGLLIMAGAVLLMVILAPLLLRNQDNILAEVAENSREYLIEMRVKAGSDYIGKSIEGAGMRNLEGLFLTEIIREDRHIVPVPPSEVLQDRDILLFAGDTGALAQLNERFAELELAKTQQFNLVENTRVVEVIITQNSALDYKTAKELGFRQLYDAAIIGIHRRGEKLSGKIGSIALRTGDVLLVIAGKDFFKRNSQQGDLIVLNALEEEKPLEQKRKIVFWLGAIGAIGLSAFGVIKLYEALLLLLVLQVALKMVNIEMVKNALSFDLLIVLLASLLLGDSLIRSGAANLLTEALFSDAHLWSPMLIISSIFGVTWLLTSFVTNVAAVSIIFPLAYSLAQTAGLPYEAVFLTTAFGASCSFITPYAYQTNLMVLELGKYKFADYFKLGFLVSLVYGGIFLSFIYFNYIV